MIPILCVSGFSGSGKTTVIEQLLPRLRERGLRVGTLKHDVHGAEPDREGKDTWRHARAGSQLVMMSGPRCVFTRRNVGEEPSLESLARYFQGEVDLVLAEGFSQSHLPKIEVFPLQPGGVLSRVPNPSRLIATVRAPVPFSGTPNFLGGDAEELADLVMRWRSATAAGEPQAAEPESPPAGAEDIAPAAPEMAGLLSPDGRTVRVLIDGRELPLKPFLGRMLTGILLGFLASLKWVGDPANIRVEVRREGDPEA